MRKNLSKQKKFGSKMRVFPKPRVSIKGSFPVFLPLASLAHWFTKENQEGTYSIASISTNFLRVKIYLYDRNHLTGTTKTLAKWTNKHQKVRTKKEKRNVSGDNDSSNRPEDFHDL